MKGASTNVLERRKMNISIGEYEVEINATGKKFTNEKDTIDFLNKLSILASEAEKSFKVDGYKGLAEKAHIIAMDI